MKKLSKILKESVWGGMLDRSTGDSIRKEDDIITYDGQRMVEYIIKHYRINDTSEYPHYYKSDDALAVPVITWKDKENKQMYHINPVFYEYKPNVIYVSDQTHKDTLEKIKSNPSYLTETYEYNYVSIRPKKGDVNNRFLLEVIDFILDITKPTTYPIPDDLPKHILDKKKVNESVWGGMLDRSVGDAIRKEDGKIVQKLEIDGVLYKFTNIFWEMGNEFNEENSDEWTCFAFDKPKNGSSLVTGYGEKYGAFGVDDSDISEKDYDVYVIKDYFDRDKFLETLLENGGRLKEFNGPREIADILWNYTKKILDDNHMSEYAHHKIFDITNSDYNETFAIYAVTDKEDLDIPEDENFIKDDITDGHVISFPILGDKNNPWTETLTRELIEAYQKLGWKQVESYELDPWSGWARNEDALMFVKLKEGFVPKEPEYDDEEDYRDF